MRTSNLLTSDQVAERLNVKPHVMRTWRRRGKGPRWTKFGVAVVYELRHVEEWEREQAERSA